MAVSTSNVQMSTLGNKKVVSGDWSCSVGDAAGTIGVGGGRVYLAQFNPQNSSTPTDGFIQYSVSTSGAVTTVTFYPHGTVTSGTFFIVYA